MPRRQAALSGMFTVCPKCALTLVVTAADLRVAQGYVRCGRCSSVFNALARLADDRQAPGAEAAAADAPAASVAEEDVAASAEPAPEAVAAEAGLELEPEPASAPAPPTEEAPVSDDAMEFDPSRTDVTSVFVEPPPDPQWTAATGSFKAMVAANQDPRDADVEVEIDSAFLAEMLKPDAAPAADSAASPPAPEPPAAPAPTPAARTPAAPAPPAAAAAAAPAPPPAPQTARTRQPLRQTAHARPPLEAAATPAPRPPPATPAAPPAEEPGGGDLRAGLTRDALELEEEKPRSASRALLTRFAWPAGIACAALVLAAQILNHYREQLAASPRLNRPLTALYAAFGVHLVPHWDLRAYDVRQLGADVDPGGTITVRASIKNAAQQAQPLPLLRVTLQDRFGNRIASRDVEPHSYLPRSIPASALLAAGQRIDAQMGFVDPGAAAVGFELDACLPSGGGAITCANDTSTR